MPGDAWVAGLSEGALGGYPFGWHARYAGMDYVNHWIPACAGTTVAPCQAARCCRPRCAGMLV